MFCFFESKDSLFDQLKKQLFNKLKAMLNDFFSSFRIRNISIEK